ncbi:TRAP transporter substrate-binding protein DctP [Acuticoccus sediminis]|nr:TRAP transporter substrate-binding protein DctP [Acuticoccus sediminis]
MKSIVLACAAAALSTGALAQEVTLRMGDSLPVGHVIAETATKPFIDRVESLSNGTVKIDYFPAEQVGKAKDFLRLTQAGLIDIGYIGPSYVPEKMPLSAVAELPGASKTSCEVMRTYWRLAREGGFLFEKEYQPNGIRPLFVVALPPYQLILASDSVASVDDLEGQKLRAAGGAQSLTLEKLGMVPVRMAPPEIYDSMSRGTVDGALLALISVDSYKLTDLTKAITTDQNFGTIAVAYSISERKWRTLPEAVQNVLGEAGDQVVENACAAFDEKEGAASSAMKAAGVGVVSFDESGTAALQAANASIAEAWATELDSRDQPGHEALAAFRTALDAVRGTATR